MSVDPASTTALTLTDAGGVRCKANESHEIQVRLAEAGIWRVACAQCPCVWVDLNDLRRVGGSEGPATSRFARSKDGKTIHTAECRLAATGVPWRWADDKTDHEIAWMILETSWLRACKRCMGRMADAL